MNYLEELNELIEKNNGMLISKDVDKVKIPRIYISKLLEDGVIKKVGRGIYVAVDYIEDEMFYLQVKYPQIIYSHETALYLHGLTDRAPFEYSTTVPSGYNVVKNLSENVKVYYIKRELHKLNVVETKTNFGNIVRIYSIERTICDILRSRNRIDIQIVNESIKRFVKIESVDYSTLMTIGKKMKIESVIRNYLEVLL